MTITTTPPFTNTMSEQQILLGSLSQDLFRISNFIQTGSVKSAERFWRETKRWIEALEKENNPFYLKNILHKLSHLSLNPTSLEHGELILTYGVITQSVAVHGVK
jgi:hypothetical protein